MLLCSNSTYLKHTHSPTITTNYSCTTNNNTNMICLVACVETIPSTPFITIYLWKASWRTNNKEQLTWKFSAWWGKPSTIHIRPVCERVLPYMKIADSDNDPKWLCLLFLFSTHCYHTSHLPYLLDTSLLQLVQCPPIYCNNSHQPHNSPRSTITNTHTFYAHEKNISISKWREGLC